MLIKRGEVYFVDLPKVGGSIQHGLRPVVVVSNDINNKFSTVINVVILTSKPKRMLPPHVLIEVGDTNFLVKESIACCEQILLVEKNRFQQGNRKGILGEAVMDKINVGMQIQLGMI